MTTEGSFGVNASVIDRFRKISSENGSCVAVEFRDESITFEEIDSMSDLAAIHIRGLSDQPVGFVGLCLERSIEMVMWIFAIIKSGGIYVPLLSDIPKMRLNELLTETKCNIIVTSNCNRPKFEESSASLVVIDNIQLSGQHKSSRVYSEVVPVGENKPCCCIFTSGSSGKPKGVLISQKNIFHTSVGGFSYLNLSPRNDRYASYASIVFTVSLLDIFTPLLNGMCLVIIPEEIRRNPNLLMDYVNEKRITCLHIPPAILKLLPKKKFDHELTFLRFGGETCDEETLNFWSGQVKCLINSYGLTESCATCLMKKDWKPGDGPTNIGIAFSPHNKCYILDDQLREIKEQGIIGELYIEGPQITSNGYLNQPRETNEKFINNPFSKEKDSNLLLRTGDFCHFNEKFEVIYRCRIDHQVKIRGNRIDLMEIESVIRKSKFVQDSVIVVRRDQLGNKRLVVFITLDRNEVESLSEEVSFKKRVTSLLKSYCTEHLRSYMIPSKFVILENFPKTFSGKRDRQELNKIEVDLLSDIDDENTFIPPTSNTEKKICEIWKQILRIDRVGLYNNFFELGGDSLLVTLMINQVNKVFETNFSSFTFVMSQNLDVDTISKIIDQKNEVMEEEEGENEENERKIQKNHFVYLLEEFREHQLVVDWNSDPPIRYFILDLSVETSEVFSEVLSVIHESFLGSKNSLGNPFFIDFSEKEQKIFDMFMFGTLKESEFCICAQNEKNGEILGCTYIHRIQTKEEKKKNEEQKSEEEKEMMKQIPKRGRAIFSLMETARELAKEEFGEDFGGKKTFYPGMITKYNAPANVYYTLHLLYQDLAKSYGFEILCATPLSSITQNTINGMKKGVYKKHKSINLNEFNYEGEFVFKGYSKIFEERMVKMGRINDDCLSKRMVRLENIYSVSRDVTIPIEKAMGLV